MVKNMSSTKELCPQIAKSIDDMVAKANVALEEYLELNQDQVD